jgi:hypothetical protein
MKRIPTIKYGLMAIVIALAVMQSTVFAQGEAPKRSLEGVWELRTTPRNCTTGDPIPTAAFEAIYTFQSDGTLSATVSGGAPFPFHGLWRREHGWSDYSFKQVRILRNAAGLFSGKQEIGGTLTLSESGDELTSDEYMIVYSIDGVPGTPACINSVGTRFKLAP